MSGTLTASFRLTLQDQLSGPLAKLQAQLEKLQRLVGGVGMGGLENAEKTLNAAAGGADRVTKSLGRTEDAVMGVSSSARRMGSEFRAATDQAMAGLDRLQQKARGSYFGNVRGALGHLNEAAEQAGGRAMGAAMTGFGLIEPVEKYAELDQQIRQTAIDMRVPMGGLDAYIGRQRAQDYQIALATGQSSRDVAGAAHYLALTHMNQGQINQLLPGMAKVSTAYNADMYDVAATAFHANEALGIKPGDMMLALAHAARAGMMGHVSFGDMAQLLPGLLTQAGSAGYSGMKGLDQILSYLVISRRGSATAGEAQTNLSSFLTHIFEPVNRKAFAKAGIDLPGILRQADKQGVDPIKAVLQRAQTLMKGGSAIERSLVLGALFGRQQETDFTRAVFANFGLVSDFQTELGGVNQKDVAGDLAKQMQGVTVLMKQLGEETSEISDRFAIGFIPVLRVVSSGLGGVLSAIKATDDVAPGFSTGIITALGGTLALATGLGAIGAVAPLVSAGWGVMAAALAPIAPLLRLTLLPLLPFRAALFAMMLVLRPFGAALRLLLAPFRALGGVILRAGGALEAFMGGTIAGLIVLVAAVAAAVIDIILHWNRFRAFFGEMGKGLRQILNGQILTGLKTFATGAGLVIKQLFVDLMHWVDGWTGGFGTRILKGIAASWTYLTNGLSSLVSQLQAPFQQLENSFDHSRIGHLMGFGSPAGATGAHRSEIHITHDPGLVPHARTLAPGVTYSSQAAARGPMTSRP